MLTFSLCIYTRKFSEASLAPMDAQSGEITVHMNQLCMCQKVSQNAATSNVNSSPQSLALFWKFVCLTVAHDIFYRNTVSYPC